MGLALLIVVMKAVGLRTGDTRWDDAARFWIRIFGINFAVGVVTGIPMEFQFGTNWAAFSQIRRRRDRPDAGDGRALRLLSRVELSRPARVRRASARAARPFPGGAGALRRQLAVGLLHRLHQRVHAVPGRPCALTPNGALYLADFWAFLLSPWAIAQYAHTMVAAVVTASFVMAAVGAYYALQGASSRSGASLPSRGRHRRCRLERAGRVSDGRSTGQARRAAPAGEPGGHGRTLRERAHGRHRLDRSAEHQGEAAGQPDRRARLPQLSRIRHVPRRRRRARPVSPGHLARQHRAALLRLPRDGRAGHAVHRS